MTSLRLPWILLFTLFTVLFGESVSENPEIDKETKEYPGYETITDSLLATATLRQKVGQLFFVPVNGEFLSQEKRIYKEITDLIVEEHIGGLIFMSGDIYGQAILTNKLQSLSDIPLWITQDMEYGAAMRISGSTRFTPAMGVAATGNKRNAFMMGKITALEAKAMGVHQIYAPVLDVNNNPSNPVINVRSFSGDPRIVSDFGLAFIQGVQSEGIVATAKHFPGHGDTGTDSHLELPVVNHNYARLDSVELLPFRNAINGGISSVMSAHIAFPQVSRIPDLPSTLDSTVLSEILYDSLNFDGVVVTDGLEMKGISSKYSPGQAVVEALKAGADIMLISPDTHTAIDEVVAAVERGQISEKRIDKSFRKIIQWKEEHDLFDGDNNVEIDLLDSRISTKYHEAEAKRIARESVTILKNDGSILPIDPKVHKKIFVLNVSDDTYGNTGSYFVRSLRDYHPDISWKVYDKRSDDDDEREILEEAKEADLIIIGSFISLRYLGPIHLDPDQASFIQKLISINKPSVLANFGNPYLVSDMSETDVHILGWINSRDQISAVVPALFGASTVKGKLPIDIPGMYSIGDGLDFYQSALRYGTPEEVGLSSRDLFKIEDLLRDAIRDSVFPGAVVGVVKDGVLAYRQEVGYHTYEKVKQVEDSDVYDLASITKVVSTTTAAMKLIDEGKLNLDDEVRKYIPEFNIGNKKNIQIKDLLLHESGLPPFRVYVDTIQNRADIIQAIKEEPLIYEPGTDYQYSDLGMILLAEIISGITGKSIDAYMRGEFYSPMGMYGAYFNPKRVSRWYVDRIPPTELDTVYRDKLIQAEVNDERAWYMDGVAGHAGLFATIDDLAKWSTMILNEGIYDGKEYLSAEVIFDFTREQSSISGRGYGFDRKSKTGFTTAGQLSGYDTFGHLGFTGTSIWIDRERNMSVILLTNRTFPHRSFGKRISEIRAKVADAAFSALKN